MPKENLSLKKIFNLALQNHKVNNIQIAEKLYKKILKINPNHLDSIFLLGSLSLQIKNFDKARQLLQKTIKINPDHADAHFNLGILFKELGELQKAMSCYTSVIEINPNHADAHFNLGILFKELGELQKAMSCYTSVIEINPNHADAHFNLGILFKELGELQKAMSCYTSVIENKPNHADAHYNLGVVNTEIGNLNQAMNCYSRVIEINPENINAIRNISILQRNLKFGIISKKNRIHFKKIFLSLFKRKDIDHEDIYNNAKLILFNRKNHDQMLQIINSDSLLLEKTIIHNLLKEELFHLMLQKSLIKDQFLEKMLTKLRYQILFNFVDSNKNILNENFEFIVSLAEQCFFNEYVFIQSKKEIDNIDELKNLLENNKKINELGIAILGCYVPLYLSKKITNQLLNYKSKNNLFNDLITMQIKEPLKEKELMNSIKSFEKISDNTSMMIRDQYEENPYPRWRYNYSTSTLNFLISLNDQIKPNKIDIKNKFNKPNILIAGCGTGKHVLIANDYSKANILANDLSLSSLAFAKRKVHELGLKNIHFLHTDILQLKKLNRKFDVIECMGVLHHMKDPLKGLEILVDLLEPHGFLFLGLYSEIARQNIIRAREFIKINKFKATLEDIRVCRQEIFNAVDNPKLQRLSKASDFYSTSTVRDLIFNVQEHRFTLLQISKILKKFKLEFLGFIDLNLKNKFSKLFPNDKKNTSLDNWHKFEITHPSSFNQIYRFWVKKVQ